MTYKEWVEKNKPNLINKNSAGGVEGCPYVYGLETRMESGKNCAINDGGGCKYCWNRVMLHDNIFTKENLKTGMVIEYASGDRDLVVGNTLMGKDKYATLYEYDINLIPLCERDKDLIIVRVYITSGRTFDTVFESENLKLIWDRDNYIMTKEKAEEKLKELLGKNVTIR